MPTTDNTSQRDLEAENRRLRLLAAHYRDRICESDQCQDCPLSNGECLALEDESQELDIPDIAAILEFATKLVNSFANTGYCSCDCQFREDVCEDVAPNTNEVWCEVIRQAKKLGLAYDVTVRKERADTRTSEELRATNKRLVKVLNSQELFFMGLRSEASEQLNALKAKAHL